MKMISEAKEIYNLLEDEESKDIFLKQVMFHISGNYDYIFEMEEKYVRKFHDDFNWKTYIEKCKDISKKSDLYIYGAGGVGITLKMVLEAHNVRVKGFIDRKKELNDVIAPADFFDFYSKSQDGEVYVTIGSEMYFKEIYSILLENGIKKEHIIGSTADISLQYFDEKIIQYKDGEIFVDCGALDGMSCVHFNNKCDRVIDKMYAFEPDVRNIERCKETAIEKNVDFKVMPYGVYSKNGEMHFNSVGGGTSGIGEGGKDKIDVCRIDSMLEGEAVSFIKMDIEGAEYDALLGAENTIKKYKPKLAISVYHKPDDYLMIPKLIHDFVPEYKLYMRHYSIYPIETVLYAIIK